MKNSAGKLHRKPPDHEKIIVILTLFPWIAISSAQEAEATEKRGAIGFNVQFINVHFWRGYAVTTTPMLGSKLHYQSHNEIWKIGFWGELDSLVPTGNLIALFLLGRRFLRLTLVYL